MRAIASILALLFAAPAENEDPPPRDGIVEISLGSVALGAGAALVAWGGVELARGLEQQRRCAEPDAFDVADCTTDPASFDFAASGLAFGFSVPVFVAGGFLLAKGVRARREARSPELSLTGGAGRGGGSLGVVLRF